MGQTIKEMSEYMILLLDVGNTNIYAGIYDQVKLIDTFRLNTVIGKTPDEYYQSLQSFVATYKITDVMISSVVPKVTIELKKLAQKFYNVAALVVEPGIKTGILIKADNPREVGADLICVAAGLIQDVPTLIIDLGTATKYIYVKNKTIMGVIIAPGIYSSMMSLTKNTALLPEVELNVPPKVLGNNTAACIQSGILYGNASAIDGLITRISREVNEPFDIVLTGGLSSIIEPLMYTKAKREPRLVLQGMINIYNKNRHIKGESK